MSDPQPTRSKQALEEENKKLLDSLVEDEPTPTSSSPVPPAAEVEEEEPETPDVPSPSASEEVPESPKVSSEEPSKKEEPEKEKSEKPKEYGDLQKRYVDSTKEAQRLYRNNSQMMAAISEATSFPEPTDDEMKTAYPNWEDMTETEHGFAKESFVNKRFRDAVAKAAAQQKGYQDWNDRVDQFVEDPQTLIDFPELEGKQEAFKLYISMQDKIIGTDFRILVGAFLHEESKKPNTKNKGEMFPTGSGGPNDKPKHKTDKLTLEQAEVLKQSNYKRYVEYVKAGKIEEPEI